MEEKIKAAIKQWFENKTSWDFTEPDAMEKWAADLTTAIAPHLVTTDDWEDAPPWANYRTEDEDGDVVFWKQRPVLDTVNNGWTSYDARVEFREITYKNKGWENSLKQRP